MADLLDIADYRATRPSPPVSAENIGYQVALEILANDYETHYGLPGRSKASELRAGVIYDDDMRVLRCVCAALAS